MQTCQEDDVSFRQMDMFINFSEPYVTKRFDANACTWAFGMNLFDLKEWRRQDLTALYHKYLREVCKVVSFVFYFCLFADVVYGLMSHMLLLSGSVLPVLVSRIFFLCRTGS